MVMKFQITKLLQGRTLYWLSKETGIRWPTIKSMATGKTQRVDLDMLTQLCRVLECTPNDLLQEEIASSTKSKTRKGPKKR